MSEPLRWFPFHVDRFQGSRRVRRLNAEGVGIYLLLMLEQWDHGPIPDDDEELAHVGRASAAAVRTVLERCFTLTAEGWLNDPLEDVRTEQSQRSDKTTQNARKAGIKSGEARRATPIKKGRNARSTHVQPTLNETERKRTEVEVEVEVDKKREEGLLVVPQGAPAPPVQPIAGWGFLEAYPVACEILGGLKHEGGVKATAATLKYRFLYPDDETMADPVVKGLPLPERERLVVMALLEFRDQGHATWERPLFTGFLKRIKEQGHKAAAVGEREKSRGLVPVDREGRPIGPDGQPIGSAFRVPRSTEGPSKISAAAILANVPRPIAALPHESAVRQ